MTAFPKSASHENRLARETSPYLLQHKHNPVDWWPWGPEALAEAQRSGRPILLSIGYAACHWCHVMAHESFEDPATAAVMNELFVNIKVDREERPDIDQIYMSALHMLGQQGGWPLTMILTPAGEPFWGGTYFPNVSRYGRPSFVDVLREIARIFHEEPGRVEHNRAALMARLAESAGTEGRVAFGIPELDRIAGQLAGAIDLAHGGLQGAPKFPQCAMLEFLWRAGMRALHRTPAETGGSRASGESRGSGGFAPPEPFSENSEVTLFSMMRRKNEYLDLFALSMERMSEGGIYDHLGGGFARYSVDERWLVPHFEKMLYDNAQLLELLALAHVHSGHPLFSARAIETVGWLEREMTTPEGAFCASLDADSEGEEGRFYVWSMAELDRALGAEDAAVFAAHYDATATGNFEGHTILNRLQRLDEFRNAQSGRAYSPAPLDPDAESQLAPLRHRLLAARSLRARPGLDDKVLADWNGLMIAALVNAGLLLDRPGWIALARRAFDFIARAMTRDDRFGHSWREGRLLFPGLASDFAAMIRAALALFEATAERPFLDRAIAWQSALERHYADPETGGYFLTADDAEALIVRPASTHDDAIPNPNGLAAQNLVRLAILAGDDRWRDRADQVFDGLLPIAARNLFGHLSLLNALDMRLRAAEVVIVRSCAHNDPLIVAAQHLPFTERILLRTVSEDGLPPSHPVRAKLAAAPTGATAAFVCVGDRCSLPVTTPAQLRALVAGDAV